jgi:thioesterase domain-containing protein
MSDMSSKAEPPRAGGLVALFALANRNGENVILPLNDAAHTNELTIPAFYCIHSVSGVAGPEFTRLAALMPKTRFFGLQAPPKKMADKDFGSSLSGIGDYYARTLDKFQPDGDFYLGGWSGGATVALETAVNLHSHGRTVRLIAAIEGAPENTGADLPAWDPRCVVQSAANLPRWVLHDPVEGRTSASAAFIRLFVRPILSRRQGHGSPNSAAGLDLAVRKEIWDFGRYPVKHQLFMERLYNAAFEYWAKPYLDPVVLYEATVQPIVNRRQFARAWRTIAPHTSVVSVSGTHVSIMRTKHLNTIASDLERRIQSPLA